MQKACGHIYSIWPTKRPQKVLGILNKGKMILSLKWDSLLMESLVNIYETLRRLTIVTWPDLEFENLKMIIGSTNPQLRKTQEFCIQMTLYSNSEKVWWKNMACSNTLRP